MVKKVWISVWITFQKRSGKTSRTMDVVYNYPIIYSKNKSFPPFFAVKRYKLCNFAPKYEMVDKVISVFIIS
jgi:hypothetical protein